MASVEDIGTDSPRSHPLTPVTPFTPVSYIYSQKKTSKKVLQRISQATGYAPPQRHNFKTNAARRISVSWNRIEGRLVMFWYQCSQVTDSLQSEAWLEKHFDGKYDNGHRRASCDAQNFAHCIHAIRDANRIQNVGISDPAHKTP